jgi:hypothetical protein
MVIQPASVDSTTVAAAGTGEPKDDERDQDTDDTPETPLDEPRPPRIQDPPTQPDQKGPYVVRNCAR